MRKKLLVLSLTVLAGKSAFAQEDVLITANRVPLPQESITEDYAVITKEEIKKYGLTSIADLLKYVSGVFIASNGGFGQPTSVFVQGLSSDKVLVMINGVPVYDPSTPHASANFNYIDLSNVERIEVIKGPQGALYGSDAIAGVINIITRKPKEKEVSLSLEGGKYKTFKESLYSGFPLKKGFLAFNFTNFKTNGFSATNSKSPVYEPDNDGYRYKTGWFSFGYEPTDWLRLKGDVKVKGASVDFDANYPGYSIPKAKSTYDNFFTDLKLDATLSEKLAVSATFGNNRDYRGTPYGNYDGVVRYLSVQPIYYLFDNLFITGGVNYRQEVAEFGSRASAHLKSGFVEVHGSYGSLVATGALRRDLHSTFGGKTTYKVSLGYTLRKTSTSFKAQYGTGFRAPSLYELYAPYYGNQELKPEKSEGYGFGISQKLPFLPLKVSLNYFKNRVWNLIDMPWWQGVYTYKNYNRAITEGVEVKGSLKLTNQLSLYGSYTHLRAKEFNPATNSWERLDRRPKFSYTLGFKGKLSKVNFSAWLLHYSDREDAGHTLGGFTTYNCYLSYSLTKKTKVYLKGYNLTDKKYELAYGYNTMGRALFVGTTFTFR
ncbi:TonB-dependent receptor plug domain-containing protein [Thermovibrio sp.]